MIHVVEGKSRAARRLLSMAPEVYNELLERCEAVGCPAEGWVFPAGSASGHLEKSSAKIQQAESLRKPEAAHNVSDKWANGGRRGPWQEAVSGETGLKSSFIIQHSDEIEAGLKPFQPCCIRHSAMTRLAEAGCDAFALARIAANSSITITQRYCHPQADAIERAFSKLGGHKIGRSENLLPTRGAGQSSATETIEKA